jgi:hypothetical protein
VEEFTDMLDIIYKSINEITDQGQTAASGGGVHF